MYVKGATEEPWLTQPIDIAGASNVTFKNCTVDDGRIRCYDGSEVNFDGVAWVNAGGDVLRLRGSSDAFVFNQSTRNGSTVVSADVELEGGSQVFFVQPFFK